MRIRFILLIILCFIIFSACSQGPQQKPKLPQGKIGVIFSLIEEDIFQIMKKTMEEEARKQDVVLTLVEIVPNQDELRKKVDEMLQEDIDAAIIQFGPGQGNREIATKIMEKGIKLVSMGVMPEEVPLDGHVTPDFTRIGQLQGSFISAKLEGNQGEVAIYTFDTDTAAFAEMVKEAAAELEKAQIRYNVKYLPSDDMEGAADAVAGNLSQNFNITGAIFPSSILALKGVEALDTLGRDPKVVTVGMGANKDAAEAIKQGLHDGEVDYMPQMLARSAVMAAAQLVKHDQWDSDETLRNGNFDVPAVIIPVRLITQENTYLLDDRLKLIGKRENNSSNQSILGNPQSSGNSPMNLTIETKEGRQAQIQIPKPIANLEIGPEEEGEKGLFMLTIETIEGQIIEMEIPGEILSLKLQQAKKE